MVEHQKPLHALKKYASNSGTQSVNNFTDIGCLWCD